MVHAPMSASLSHLRPQVLRSAPAKRFATDAFACNLSRQTFSFMRVCMLRAPMNVKSTSTYTHTHTHAHTHTLTFTYTYTFT